MLEKQSREAGHGILNRWPWGCIGNEENATQISGSECARKTIKKSRV